MPIVTTGLSDTDIARIAAALRPVMEEVVDEALSRLYLPSVGLEQTPRSTT